MNESCWPASSAETLVEWLSVIYAVMLLGTIIVTHIVARNSGRLRSAWTLFCNSGKHPPASLVFSGGLAVTATIQAIVVVAAALKAATDQTNHAQEFWPRLLSIAALTSGIASSIFLLLMGVIGIAYDIKLHNQCANSFAACGSMYMLIYSIGDILNRGNTAAATIRLSAGIVAIVAAILTIPFAQMEANIANIEFHQSQMGDLNRRMGIPDPPSQASRDENSVRCSMKAWVILQHLALLAPITFFASFAYDATSI